MIAFLLWNQFIDGQIVDICQELQKNERFDGFYPLYKPYLEKDVELKSLVYINGHQWEWFSDKNSLQLNETDFSESIGDKNWITFGSTQR